MATKQSLGSCRFRAAAFGIAGAIILLIGLGAWTVACAAADQIVVPSMRGRVFVDGRPTSRTVEISLQGQDSAVVMRAYTAGSAEFEFRDFQLVLEQNYYLVVREEGFKELRYALNMNDFVRDSATPLLFHFAGTIQLNLETLSPDRKYRKTGSKIVDARQLKAEIPQEARRQYSLGLEKITGADRAAAIEHLEAAVALAPEFYDALNKLGAEYLKAGQFRNAETMLERARELNANDPLPLTNLGILYLQEGAMQSASGKKIVEGNPGAASFRKAAEVFEKALRLDPLSPRVTYYAGNAFYNLGEYRKAESLLLHALSLDGRLHEARLTLLNIYTREQRHEAALRQISAFIKANPNSPERQRLEAIKTQIESALAGRPR